MDKSKSTKSDRVGRTKRRPRDPSPDREKSGWNPSDDIYGKKQRPVDADLDFDGGYDEPPPKR